MQFSSLATLGPVGTDAETMGRKISDNVMLCASFPDAVEYAQHNNSRALVACGYRQMEDGRVIDSWVDLHFRFYEKMKVIATYCENTKPMCLAKRMDCTTPRTLVIHPATETFAGMAPWPVSLAYVDAKPEAARRTAGGEYDSCIASVDVVANYNNLEIVKEFEPQMVWVVYEKS